MIDLWDNIKTFYLITKFHSFKEAARYLQLNSSTITRHIRQLEDTFNNKLFESRYPIILSEQGKRLLKYVELPCQSLLDIDEFQKSNLKANSIKENPFTLYVNDLYFFHLLAQLYDCDLVHQSLAFNNISLSENDNLILDLIKQEQSNFIYLTTDEVIIKEILQNSNYITWSIKDMPICHFFTDDTSTTHSQFFYYEGQIQWLKDLHHKYVNTNKIQRHNITSSNSIELIFDLLKCGGQSILPGIILDDERYKDKLQFLKYKKLTSHKLSFVCHNSDVFLRLIF